MPALTSNTRATYKRASYKREFDTFKYKTVRMLTTSDVKEISQLAHAEAKEVMTFKLGLNTYNDEEDQLKAIFVDYLHDSLTFAVNRGFPWKSVCDVIEFAYQFMRGICWSAEGESLTDAIVTLKIKAGRLDTLTDRQMMLYIDHMSANVFHHYNLYRLVFCKPRDTAITSLTKLVESPDETLPLDLAKEVNRTYFYDIQMAKLKCKEQIMNERLDDARTQTRVDRWTLPPVQDAVRELNKAPVTRANADAAALGIASTILETLKDDFENHINKFGEALDNRLTMKLVPKPEEHKPKEFKVVKSRKSSKGEVS